MMIIFFRPLSESCLTVFLLPDLFVAIFNNQFFNFIIKQCCLHNLVFLLTKFPSLKKRTICRLITKGILENCVVVMVLLPRKTYTGQMNRNIKIILAVIRNV